MQEASSERVDNSGKVVKLLTKIKDQVPVEWDRFTFDETIDLYVVYGWIPRSDGQRDFVSVHVIGDQEMNDAFVTTSSAKYSELISRVVYGDEGEHNPCRKIEDLMPENIKTRKPPCFTEEQLRVEGFVPWQYDDSQWERGELVLGFDPDGMARITKYRGREIIAVGGAHHLGQLRNLINS